MCGIAGFTEVVGQREHCLRVMEEMLEAITARGPEATTSKEFHGTTLGHCKLSFVDAENGRQPCISDSNQCAILLNGEIYNHRELRQELRAAGVSFQTATDTETVLRLYEYYGLKFLSKLRGMFALAIHDHAQQRTILARDPMGKKPLYYFRTPNGLAFASELKALLKHPWCPRRLDPQNLGRYFVFNALPAPWTMLSGVLKLRPGSFLVFSGSNAFEQTYWNLPISSSSFTDSEEVLEHEFERLLRSAISKRLNSSDVPLGVLLSGGVDSSLVTAIAQELSNQPLKTFTAGFDDESYDESAHAEKVARHLGTEHHSLRLSGADLADVVLQHYSSIDEPLADPSLMPTILISREARKSVKGVLSGDGADEMLMGYQFFQVASVLRQLDRLPAIVTRSRWWVRRLPVRHSNMHYGFVLALLSRGLHVQPERKFYGSTCAFTTQELSSLLKAEVWRELSELNPFDELDAFIRSHQNLSFIERVQAGMICHFLQDVILTKVDRGSMLNSLEVRSPFLDIDLIEFMLRVPMKMRLKGRNTKHILKKVAEKKLSSAIVRRRKQGFRAPVARLLAGELRAFLLDMLSESNIRRTGLFDHVRIKQLIEEHLNLSRDNQKQLWSLLCFQIWHDRYAN